MKQQYEYIPGSGKKFVQAVSSKRRAKHKLMRMYGITSGRQWRILRKRLKRGW